MIVMGWKHRSWSSALPVAFEEDCWYRVCRVLLSPMPGSSSKAEGGTALVICVL